MLTLYKSDGSGDEDQVVDQPVHSLRLRRSLFVVDADTKYTLNPIYDDILKNLFTKMLLLLSSGNEQSVPNAKFHGLARISSVVRHVFEACKKSVHKTKRGGNEVLVGKTVDTSTVSKNFLTYEYIDFAIFKDMINMLENETLLRALWTDLTCICRYKYDLTTFEQGKDVPLPNTKKGIFDVSGCRTLQSHQTLASAITKWWDPWRAHWGRI